MSVNATEAGVIREFFANEEDTVVVGQDLVRIEIGAEGEAKPAAAEAPKEESKPTEKPAEKPAAAAPAESKPEAPKPAAPSKPAAAAPKPAPKQESAPSPLGNREERRVRLQSLDMGCTLAVEMLTARRSR